MQGIAVGHAIEIPVNAINEVFGKWLITHGLCPHSSPNFKYCDYCLWGTLNDRVYGENSYSLQELTDNIQRQLFNMSIALLCEYKHFQKLLIWHRRRTLELQGSCVKWHNSRESTDSKFLMNAGFLCRSATATMLRDMIKCTAYVIWRTEQLLENNVQE
jgi:hypothetical protein